VTPVVFLETGVANDQGGLKLGLAGKTKWTWVLAFALAGVVAMAGLAGAVAQPPANGNGNGNGRRMIDIKPSEDGKGQTITVRSKQDSGFALVELVNTKTKAVERVLYAGTISDSVTVHAFADDRLKPGTYMVRVRDGIDVVLDKVIDRPDTKDGKWVNPSGLCLQNGAIYVVDGGLETPALVLDPNPEKEWVNDKKEKVKGTFVTYTTAVADAVTIKPSDNPNVTLTLTLSFQPVDLQEFVKVQGQKQADWAALRAKRLPHIVKMNLDGSKVTNWGASGVLDLAKTGIPPGWLRTFVVDESGVGYLPSSGHHALRVGQLGIWDDKYTVGGWDNNPAGPVCTVWVANLAAVGPKKLYIPNNGYANAKIYDPTKPAFEGILFATAQARNFSLPNAIAADAGGNVYMCDQSNLIVKLQDNGKAWTEKYFTDPELKLFLPTGITTSASLVLFGSHGPGPGPFWDSGGGGEFVILWDNGKELARVTRFGAPGFVLENKEFLNPSGIAITPDHSALIVAEDGMVNTDGPAGNARVTRWRLKHLVEDSAPVELKPVK
jgi:hypothetical protein